MTRFSSLIPRVLTVGCLLLVLGCTPCYGPEEPPEPPLVCLNIIDREGFSTAVHSRERLSQYTNVDFLCPQGYQKVMGIYARDECGDIAAFITSYYSNGQIKQYLDVINSRANGQYREWHDNGKLKLECSVVGGDADLTAEAACTWIFDGECKAWDNCGNLAACIPYCKGTLDGEARYYFPSGKERRRTIYKSNLPDGKTETYFESGEVLEFSNYDKGIQTGEAKRYWLNRQVAGEELYQDGRLLTGCYYNTDGKIISEITQGDGYRALFDDNIMRVLQEYHSGQPEGEVKLFDPTGRQTSLFHVKNGMKHGEDIIYNLPWGQPDAVPLPKLLITWHEDKIHGMVKSWYDNGMPESQREMSNNMRNGIFSAWYRKGGLMLMEQYDHDKLVKGEYFKPGEYRPETRITDGSGVAVIYDADGNLIRKVHYFHGRPLD